MSNEIDLNCCSSSDYGDDVKLSPLKHSDNRDCQPPLHNEISFHNGSSSSLNAEDKSTVHAAVSKNELKKKLKKEKWMHLRKTKRAKEKAKKKLRKVEARELCLKLGPSRKELKRSTMINSSCKVQVVVDLSFDDLMNDRDIGKCTKQILSCYSLNRRCTNPMQFYVTSFNGKTSEEMKKHLGFSNWDVNFKTDRYEELFPKNSIVYLTSESEHIVDKIEEDKIYIIGGFVDHNKHKGLTHSLAVEKGISHGRLPIDKFLEMKTRRVLTIDHVFNIILNVTLGLSWKDSFLKVLPARIGAVAKTSPEEPQLLNT